MSLIIQESKIQHKISNIPGVIATIPLTATTTDFSIGGWRDTDILEGEFFFNIVDSKIFSRDTTGIIQIYPPLSGGTSIQEVVYLNTYNDRPIPGSVDKIYIVKATNKMYYYDSGLGDYVIIAFESNIYWSGIIDSPSASTVQIDMAVNTMHGVNDVNTSHYTKVESDAVAGSSGAKVDKVVGKDLSTNDFSDYWLLKLSGLTSSVLSFIDFDNFPVTGEENTIYIDKLNQKLYFWDNGIADYVNLTLDSDTFTISGLLTGTTLIFERNDSENYSVDISELTLSTGFVEKTYSELYNMFTGSTLTEGQYYKITDFKTLHKILDESGSYTGDSWEGSSEPLVLLAISSSKFDKQVYSTLYPQDIIYYDITGGDTRDIAFFDTGVAITGLKGVIYYRKDTIQNVECWYDFRNVKFRRWLVSATGWLSGDSYTEKDVYLYIDTLYKCTSSHTGDIRPPSAAPERWIKWLDKTQNWSWTSDKTQFNIGDITTDNLVMSNPIDIYTFGDYYKWLNDVHIGRIYLDYTIDNYEYSTRLNNIVFNTTDDLYTCYSNTFGENCLNNTIGNGFYYNTIGNEFYYNTIVNDFYSNTIGNGFYYNTIGNKFYYNTIGNGFYSNTIGNGFYYNTIGNEFYSNTIGNNFRYNTIGNEFYYNTIGNGFRHNDFKYCPSLANFTTATHVYGNYNCEIVKNSTGTLRLKYMDGDNDTIANITD